MNEDEQNNLFGTFEAVIMSAVNEKMTIPKWKKKLEKADIKANISLQVGQDEYFQTYLILDHGKAEFKAGHLDCFDIELIAAPEDMMWFSNKTYSTVTMITKKNEWGFPKLRAKKGMRNIGKLLFVSGVLTFPRIKPTV
jgi:hypothetical protein